MRKPVIIILSLGIILNSIAPLHAIELSSSDVIENVIAAESTVLSCFTASALPFAVLAGILQKEEALCDEFSPKAKERKHEESNKRNTSADFSITALETGTRLALRENGQEEASGITATLQRLSASYGDRYGPGGGAPPAFLVPMILAYLVLLARSSLPSEAISIISRYSPETRPQKGRVFHLWRTV